MFDWVSECKNKSVLLLEGTDDCHIIKKFCEDGNIAVNFGFCNCRGDSNLLKQLSAFLLANDNKDIIGVILDADNNVDARYQEIKDKVKKFYTLPEEMPKDGLVYTEKGQPKLGIWIMPNNQDNGALEEFYLTLAIDIDTDFINDVITQAEGKNLTSFKSQHRKKAIMHTYFSWQDFPGSSLHASINKIALDNNQDIAIAFSAWLVKLFH
ncbi:hypothetical protein BTHERMOSOX_1324 [Bathymodiolus thermophilus thioautotrophic gill symbiont]|uniref:DUF3226 domain-containing protein n=1 Tax=Bathymodiolus thermophilus thioautotrophic gill symbiont TaxID=2360 RepID=UPI0010BC556F|nr:DUF3226 domain-containing protein [Bathymodiolus thermophilus thioautotrophic gill symbiont]SHA24110.1 hypothetical protein BTHERMOSOX_1324 [Bathymodiolus thermophilus thioautotrophic gill symbiont]